MAPRASKLSVVIKKLLGLHFSLVFSSQPDIDSISSSHHLFLSQKGNLKMFEQLSASETSFRFGATPAGVDAINVRTLAEEGGGRERRCQGVCLFIIDYLPFV